MLAHLKSHLITIAPTSLDDAIHKALQIENITHTGFKKTKPLALTQVNTIVSSVSNEPSTMTQKDLNSFYNQNTFKSEKI